MNALGAAVVAAMVTACGSGGTSKSSNGQYAPEPNNNPIETNLTPIEFSSDNFTHVASQSLKSLLLNDAGSNALNRAVTVTTNQNIGLVDSVTGIILTLAPYPCSNGGDFTLKAVINNSNNNIQLDFNNQLDMSFDAAFRDCNQAGNKLDGDVGLVFTANISQLINNPVYSLESHLNVDALSVEQPNLPGFVFDGTFDYNVSSADGVTVNMEILSNNTVYFADQSYQMLDFSLNKSVNNSTQGYTYYITSEFTDSSNPGAYVAYETLAPLTGKGFSLPTAGLIAVHGSNGTMLVHAQEGENILLQLDLGDDGSIDEEYYSTWEELVLKSFNTQP